MMRFGTSEDAFGLQRLADAPAAIAFVAFGEDAPDRFEQTLAPVQFAQTFDVRAAVQAEPAPISWRGKCVDLMQH